MYKPSGWVYGVLDIFTAVFNRYVPLLQNSSSTFNASASSSFG